MKDYLIEAQKLGAEIRFEGEACILTASGFDILFDRETHVWRTEGLAGDDPEAMLTFIQERKDASDSPRRTDSDSSEPEGRRQSSSDNRSEGQSKPTRK